MKKIFAVLTIALSPYSAADIVDFTEKQPDHIYLVRTYRPHAERLECELRGGGFPPRNYRDGYYIRRAAMHRYSSDPTLYKGQPVPDNAAYTWVVCDIPMNHSVGAYEWARYELIYRKNDYVASMSPGSKREWALEPSARVPSPIAVSVQMLSWERARLENLRVDPSTKTLRGTIVAIEPGEIRIQLLVTATLK